MELPTELDLKDIPHLKYKLFLRRRFLPLFLAQFLGTFNDNMLRNGLVVLIAYAARHGTPLPIDRADILITICSGLLVLPLMLFSSVAGQLADKCEKGKLITYTKIAEILIMLGAFYGFATQHIPLLMFLLFVSGTHSTFVGPIKYSALPEHLRAKELLAGNGFVSAGNYLGILLGLISGALLVELPGNVIGYALIAVAVTGYIASIYIPRTKPAAPETEVHFYLVAGAKEIITCAKGFPRVFRAMLGLSWFLLISSVFMAQFANYATQSLSADNTVYTLFLTVFSIGIAIGATLADTLLKGEICTRFVPWALLGVSAFSAGIVFLTPDVPQGDLMGIGEFFDVREHWLIVLCMMGVAVSGGIYIVPLYALMQAETEVSVRSRVLAASNLFDSFFMTAAAIASAILLTVGFAIIDLFMILAILNIGVCFYARTLHTRYSHPAA